MNRRWTGLAKFGSIFLRLALGIGFLSAVADRFGLWGVYGHSNAIKAFPALSVYSATKAAIRSIARTWTNDLRGRQIRVNVLSPGQIDTPVMESLQQGDALTKMKEEFAKNVPLGRMGDPDEIAKTVSFLASNEASYISGIELFGDGGVAQI